MHGLLLYIIVLKRAYLPTHGRAHEYSNTLLRKENLMLKGESMQTFDYFRIVVQQRGLADPLNILRAKHHISYFLVHLDG